MNSSQKPESRSSTRSFAGVWTAIVTPFKTDLTIDWDAWERILEKQALGGVAGIVVSGTTGESPTLTVQEKVSLVRKARTLLPQNIRVMAGSGGNNTEQSIELSKLCVDAGADSLLVVTPPYNKPSPAGLQLHFSAITKAVTVPVCLYHVPGRTGQLLSPDVLATLCAIDGIDSVKEATGDLAFLTRALNKIKNKHVEFLSGDDITFLPSLALGGAGVISVLSNLLPGDMVRIYQSWTSGDSTAARRLHDALQSLMDVMFCESNPGPVKFALAEAGLIQNIVRPPLATVTDTSAELIRQTVREAEQKTTQCRQ